MALNTLTAQQMHQFLLIINSSAQQQDTSNNGTPFFSSVSILTDVLNIYRLFLFKVYSIEYSNPLYKKSLYVLERPGPWLHRVIYSLINSNFNISCKALSILEEIVGPAPNFTHRHNTSSSSNGKTNIPPSNNLQNPSLLDISFHASTPQVLPEIFCNSLLQLFDKPLEGEINGQKVYLFDMFADYLRASWTTKTIKVVKHVQRDNNNNNKKPLDESNPQTKSNSDPNVLIVKRTIFVNKERARHALNIWRVIYRCFACVCELSSLPSYDGTDSNNNNNINNNNNFLIFKWSYWQEWMKLMLPQFQQSQHIYHYHEDKAQYQHMFPDGPPFSSLFPSPDVDEFGVHFLAAVFFEWNHFTTLILAAVTKPPLPLHAEKPQIPDPDTPIKASTPTNYVYTDDFALKSLVLLDAYKLVTPPPIYSHSSFQGTQLIPALFRDTSQVSSLQNHYFSLTEKLRSLIFKSFIYSLVSIRVSGIFASADKVLSSDSKDSLTTAVSSNNTRDWICLWDEYLLEFIELRCCSNSVPIDELVGGLQCLIIKGVSNGHELFSKIKSIVFTQPTNSEDSSNSDTAATTPSKSRKGNKNWKSKEKSKNNASSPSNMKSNTTMNNTLSAQAQALTNALMAERGNNGGMNSGMLGGKTPFSRLIGLYYLDPLFENIPIESIGSAATRNTTNSNISFQQQYGIDNVLLPTNQQDRDILSPDIVGLAITLCLKFNSSLPQAAKKTAAAAAAQKNNKESLTPTENRIMDQVDTIQNFHDISPTVRRNTCILLFRALASSGMASQPIAAGVLELLLVFFSNTLSVFVRAWKDKTMLDEMLKFARVSCCFPSSSSSHSSNARPPKKRKEPSWTIPVYLDLVTLKLSVNLTDDDDEDLENDFESTNNNSNTNTNENGNVNNINGFSTSKTKSKRGKNPSSTVRFPFNIAFMLALLISAQEVVEISSTSTTTTTASANSLSPFKSPQKTTGPKSPEKHQSAYTNGNDRNNSVNGNTSMKFTYDFLFDIIENHFLPYVIQYDKEREELYSTENSPPSLFVAISRVLASTPYAPSFPITRLWTLFFNANQEISGLLPIDLEIISDGEFGDDAEHNNNNDRRETRSSRSSRSNNSSGNSNSSTNILNGTPNKSSNDNKSKKTLPGLENRYGALFRLYNSLMLQSSNDELLASEEDTDEEEGLKENGGRDSKKSTNGSQESSSSSSLPKKKPLLQKPSCIYTLLVMYLQEVQQCTSSTDSLPSQTEKSNGHSYDSSDRIGNKNNNIPLNSIMSIKPLDIIGLGTQGGELHTKTIATRNDFKSESSQIQETSSPSIQLTPEYYFIEGIKIIVALGKLLIKAWPNGVYHEVTSLLGEQIGTKNDSIIIQGYVIFPKKKKKS